MNFEDYRNIRLEVLSGTVNSRQTYLNHLNDVFKTFVRENEYNLSSVRRKFRVMENIALDILYYNKIPKGAEPDEYFKKIFGEIFRF